MLTPFERMVAFRYLRARRAEGFISIIAAFSLIGIALGVATLIVVLSVMRGVREEMVESIIGLEGHITVASASGRGVEDYEDIARGIRAMPGVESAIPVAQGQVMVSYRGQAAGAMVTGLRPQDLSAKPLIVQKFEAGDLDSFRRGEGVLMGSRMAERMGVSVGDAVTLISPEGRATPAGMVPRIKAYPVVGLFRIGMFAYDNGLILMPFEQAQVFFRLKDSGFGIQDSGRRHSLNPESRILTSDKASAIEVRSTNAEAAPALAGEIGRALGGGYRLYDWKTSNGHLFRAVMVQRNVFLMILGLIILVASFNIISSLIMLVREKGRDIGILRTMGASRAAVTRIFITCGASVGVLGTLTGVGLGLLIACNTDSIQRWLESLTGQKLLTDELYFLSSLPAKVDAGEVLTVVALALGLSLLATIYPARRAAALDPAEVLRYE